MRDKIGQMCVSVVGMGLVSSPLLIEDNVVEDFLEHLLRPPIVRSGVHVTSTESTKS
jgi:hypothetical protein